MTGEECYESAANAVKRKKFKQAKGFFLKALAKEPEYIEARRGLRAVALSQFDGKKAGALISGFSDLLQVFLCKLKKNYDDGLVAGEKFLYADPTHKWVLKQMVAFAEEKEYLQTQVHFYTILAEIDPENADLVIEAADFLSDQDNTDWYQKAVDMMARLCQAYPDDTDLGSERNRIEAKKVVNKLTNATSQTDVLKDKDAAKKLEEESQQIKTTDDLEKAIARALEREREEPNSARAKEVLADLYFRKGDLKTAMEKFQESIDIDPNNQNIHSRLGDTRIKVVADDVAALEAKLASSDGAQKEKLSAELKERRKSLQDIKLNEYGRRLKINPNDLKTRFELGGLFFSAKAFDKAIQQFQRSVQDARLSFRSSKYLGHCYRYKKLYDMAYTEFEAAAKKPGATSSDKLDVMYEAANCLELQGKADDALAKFKSILEKDFGFKDVAARVEALQK